MNHQLKLLVSLILVICLPYSPAFSQSQQETISSKLPAILKADKVDGDQKEQTITATGNVEVSKGINKLYANQVIYKKKDSLIQAEGNIELNNSDIGKLFANKAKLKDDLSQGEFTDSAIIFNDGSYLESKKILRELNQITVLKSPYYSICPNDEIKSNLDLENQRNFASIKSSQAVINQADGTIRTKHAVLKLFEIPVFYIPYLRNSLNQKERKSGFLNPQYTKSNKFGLGFRLPYYLNIAPNKDLKLTPDFNTRATKLIMGSEYRHLTKYGEYNLNMTIANNNIESNNDKNIINRTNKKIRWNFSGEGNFDFTDNTGFAFNVNNVSDKDYLRDFENNYLSNTTSRASLDYINNRTYLATSFLRFQELEDQTLKNRTPYIIPQIDFEKQLKSIFYKEKYQITSNFTSVNRNDGLRYNRISITPEVIIPFNLKGNLFKINGKVQGDLYSFDENYQDPSKQKNLSTTQTNYRPAISLEWRFPLIRKDHNKTIIIEPIVNLIASSFKRPNKDLANEDSNNSQLSFSNFFADDHIAGFDRNEAGERAVYGFRSSLFNDLGKFGLTLGQIYHKSYEQQDVEINGIGNNKSSNIIGQASYKLGNKFSISYVFQLNNQDYNNELNEIIANLNYDRFELTSNYLLIKESSINNLRREQLSINSKVKLAGKWWAQGSVTQDLESSQTISKSLTLKRDGCCTNFSFAITEQNPENLNKAVKSFSVNFAFKNF